MNVRDTAGYEVTGVQEERHVFYITLRCNPVRDAALLTPPAQEDPIALIPDGLRTLADSLEIVVQNALDVARQQAHNLRVVADALAQQGQRGGKSGG